MRYLSFNNNQLKALDISNCKRLRYIDCSENKLKDIYTYDEIYTLCYVQINNNYLDLNNSQVLNSIEKIQGIIDNNTQNPPNDYYNSFGFYYTSQKNSHTELPNEQSAPLTAVYDFTKTIAEGGYNDNFSDIEVLGWEWDNTTNTLLFNKDFSFSGEGECIIKLPENSTIFTYRDVFVELTNTSKNNINATAIYSDGNLTFAGYGTVYTSIYDGDFNYCIQAENEIIITGGVVRAGNYVNEKGGSSGTCKEAFNKTPIISNGKLASYRIGWDKSGINSILPDIVEYTEYYISIINDALDFTGKDANNTGELNTFGWEWEPSKKILIFVGGTFNFHTDVAIKLPNGSTVKTNGRVFINNSKSGNTVFLCEGDLKIISDYSISINHNIIDEGEGTLKAFDVYGTFEIKVSDLWVRNIIKAEKFIMNEGNMQSYVDANNIDCDNININGGTLYLGGNRTDHTTIPVMTSTPKFLSKSYNYKIIKQNQHDSINGGYIFYDGIGNNIPYDPFTMLGDVNFIVHNLTLTSPDIYPIEHTVTTTVYPFNANLYDTHNDYNKTFEIHWFNSNGTERVNAPIGIETSFSDTFNDLIISTDNSTNAGEYCFKVKSTESYGNGENLINYYGYSTLIKFSINASKPIKFTHTITFKDWDGTIISTQTIEKGEDAIAPETPSRSGYTFTGWDKSFNNINEDLTITAIYEIISNVNRYIVTFFNWEGYAIKTQTVKEGESATAPDSTNFKLIRDGYTFTRWDKDFINITENLSVMALYEKNKLTYQVTFTDWDGTVLKEQFVEEGSNATAPEVSARDGYNFIGWDKQFNDVTVDLEIMAVYEKVVVIPENPNPTPTPESNSDNDSNNIPNPETDKEQIKEVDEVKDEIEAIEEIDEDEITEPIQENEPVTNNTESTDDDYIVISDDLSDNSTENNVDVFIKALSEENPYIRINKNTGTVITTEFLQVVKETEKTITFELENGLIITINPNKITDKVIDIDLSILIELINDVKQINDSISVNENSIIIKPATHGEFGFEMIITIPVEILSEANLNNKPFKLFYISNENNVSEIDSLILNQDGTISISISHASSYVISEKAPYNINYIASEKIFLIEKNPSTGISITGSMTFIVTSGFICFSIRRRKYKKH